MVVDIHAVTEEILMSNASLDARTASDNRFSNFVRRTIAPYAFRSDLDPLLLGPRSVAAQLR